MPDVTDAVHSERLSIAGLYDFYLGGMNNTAAERAMAERVIALCPFTRDLARYNRDFLGRAVRYCTDEGIDQFIDIGSGFPSSGNVHEIAQASNPDAAVVYCDFDPKVVSESRVMLSGNDTATCIEGNIREPDAILDHPETQRLIDFDRPVALLIVSVLHFVGDDEDAHGLVRRYLDRLPSGSIFVASHISLDDASPQERAQLEALEAAYGDASNPTATRTKEQISEFFDGLALAQPDGVAYTMDWRAPDSAAAEASAPGRRCFYAAAGRKP